MQAHVAHVLGCSSSLPELWQQGFGTSHSGPGYNIYRVCGGERRETRSALRQRLGKSTLVGRRGGGREGSLNGLREFQDISTASQHVKSCNLLGCEPGLYFCLLHGGSFPQDLHIHGVGHGGGCLYKGQAFLALGFGTRSGVCLGFLRGGEQYSY